MSWRKVGDWIKENAGPGAALIGSLASGNLPGAIAAGASMISSATGTSDPEQALKTLQQDPETLIKLKELAAKNESEIRQHLAEMERLKLEDEQAEHAETQKTIRGGDQATDEFVRRTRPQMARQSWLATVVYCLGCFLLNAFNDVQLFNSALAGFISAPAWAYLGFRTVDKFSNYEKRVNNGTR